MARLILMSVAFSLLGWSIRPEYPALSSGCVFAAGACWAFAFNAPKRAASSEGAQT